MHTCALSKAAESEIYASACICVIQYACMPTFKVHFINADSKYIYMYTCIYFNQYINIA